MRARDRNRTDARHSIGTVVQLHHLSALSRNPIPPSPHEDTATTLHENLADGRGGVVHQHRTHLKRQAARSREKTKRQKSAARRRTAQLSGRQADARSRGETGRTARRHPSLLAIAAPMTLRPRSRAAVG